MVSLLTLSVFMCLAVHTWACCTPDQWEGYQGFQGGYAGYKRRGAIKGYQGFQGGYAGYKRRGAIKGYQGFQGGYAGYKRRGAIKEFGSVHYDSTNQRKALFLNIISEDKERKIQVVSHCKDGCRVYVVDLKNGLCWTKKMSSTFRKACIPDDAKDVGKFSLGLKGVFKVHGYEVKKHIKNGTVEARGTVSVIDDGVCVPIRGTVSGMMKGVGFMLSVGFVDITPGIKNETVFDVPKDCGNNLDMGLEAEFEMEDFVLAV